MGKGQGIYQRSLRLLLSKFSLHRMVTPALASVSLDQIRKYFRKSRDYVNAFKDGHTGYKADEVIKDYMKLKVWCNEQVYCVI